MSWDGIKGPSLFFFLFYLLDMSDSDSNSKKAYPLRISERLFEEIRKWANEDMRSVNGQIEFLLNEAVKRRGGRKADSPKQLPEA